MIDSEGLYETVERIPRIFTRMKPGDELIEYSCEENNTTGFTHGHNGISYSSFNPATLLRIAESPLFSRG